MSEIYFTAVVQNGRLQLDDLETFRAALTSLNCKPVIGTLKEKRPLRTNQQLRGVMGVWMEKVLKELGYEITDKDFVYQNLKIEMGYFEEKVNKKTGEVKKFPMRTGQWSDKKFSDFMEHFARHMAMNYGIILPDLRPELARI